MKVIGIINDCGKRNWGGKKMKQICPTLKAEAHGNLPKVVMVGGGGRSQSEVGDIAPTVMAVKIKQATKKGYIECIEGGGVLHSFPRKQTEEGQSD